MSLTPAGTGYTAIAAGTQHSLALKADGSIVSWGYNGFRQLSDKPAGTGYTAIATGSLHSLALKADGSIVSWGGWSDDYQKLLPPEGIGYTAVAAGGSHSVALQAVDPLPPLAAFSANTTAGTAPLAVQFTDESLHGPTSWAWEFGDGKTSWMQNPVHVYTAAGTYTVNLTVTRRYGSNTTSRVGFITVTALYPPVAAFSANVTSGTEPLSVRFTDESTNSPTAWAWKFGDGGTSTEQNPVHVYEDAGAYAVTLTASNADGTNTISIPRYIVIDSASLYRFVTSWDPIGTGNGIRYPRAVAVDGAGKVIVLVNVHDGFGSGPDENRVEVFDAYGTPIANWSVNDDSTGPFNDAAGITVDGAGYVYVADTWNNRIQKFAPDGVFLTMWGTEGTGNGEFRNPSDIAADGAGNVYVSDPNNRRVQKFDANGMFLANLRHPGTGEGQFWYPDGIAVGPSGDIYVTDGAEGADTQVLKFAPDGTLLVTWGGYGTGNGQFRGPSGIAVDSADSIYVTDTGNNRIQKFDADGTFITKWGSSGSGDGQFDRPSRIAVNDAGDVYVSDYGNKRVQKFSPAGGAIGPVVVALPGGTTLPSDTNADGKYDDVNGNGRADFADVVLYFNQMTWIAANEPIAAFDYNGNGRIDFADVVWLFNNL